MAVIPVPVTSPATSVREDAERIREIGQSAATHAGNAAALLRIAAGERQQSKQRS